MVTVAVGSRYSLDQAGLAALVERLPGLSLVTRDSNPPPQVLIWDTGGAGIEQLPVVHPETAVLLLLQDQALPAIPAGVAGLFSKDEAPETLGVAVRQIARGEQYMSPTLAIAILLQKQSEALPPGIDHHLLTSREREILTLLSEGLGNKAIASRLYISVRTVEGHLAKLYPLLGVHSRTEAMLVTVHMDLTPGNR